MKGVTGKLVSGWRVNGITTFQGGFPLPLTAQATTLASTFGAGTTRPNVIAGCNKIIGGSAQSRLSEWFNYRASRSRERSRLEAKAGPIPICGRRASRTMTFPW